MTKFMGLPETDTFTIGPWEFHVVETNGGYAAYAKPLFNDREDRWVEACGDRTFETSSACYAAITLFLAERA